MQGGSLAYLTYVKIREETETSKAVWEFVVHAFGPRARALADLLAAQVRAWDRDVRHGDNPSPTVHPAGTPDAELPAGHVLHKLHNCLVFDWDTGQTLKDRCRLRHIPARTTYRAPRRSNSRQWCGRRLAAPPEQLREALL